MKLKFTYDAYYNGKLKYHKDQVYEISEELGEAARWVKRGAIEVVEEKTIDIQPCLEDQEEISPDLPDFSESQEPIVNIPLKKENGRGKKRKGNLLNETSEIL